MIPFNYHHLYYFYVIATEGSISRASKILRLAQPTLSTQINQFENFLEKQLFVRSGRGLKLTEDGIHLLSYAKAIFDLGEELSNSLGDRSQKGRIKIQIGISNVVPIAIVDALLKFLFEQAETPYINVTEKSLSEMIRDLASHKLDIVLSDQPCQMPTEQGIQNHLIAQFPVVLCSNKQLAKKIHKLPEDLNNVPMILPTAQSQIYHALQEYFLTHKIKPNVVAEVQDLELARRLVLSGRGVAPINQFTVLKAPSKNNLEILGKPGQLNIYSSTYLISKKRKYPHPLVVQLLENFKPLA